MTQQNKDFVEIKKTLNIVNHNLSVIAKDINNLYALFDTLQIQLTEIYALGNRIASYYDRITKMESDFFKK